MRIENLNNDSEDTETGDGGNSAGDLTDALGGGEADFVVTEEKKSLN